MKRRTRVTAWVFVLLGIQGSFQVWNTPTIAYPDRLFLAITSIAAAAMWAFVLMRWRWARNPAIAVVVLQFLGIMHNAWVVPSPEPMWKILALVGSLAAAITGWQLFVLLTENPREWGKES